MNILILTYGFWPETFRINDVAILLKEQGHSVTVLTGQPNYPEGKIFKGYKAFKILREDWQGISIYRVPTFPRRRGSKLGLIFNYFSIHASLTLLGPILLRGKRFDSIFVYGTSPVTIGLAALPLRRLGRPKIALWVQDLWPESLQSTGYVSNQKILGWVNTVVKFLYARCDLLLGQSQPFVERIRQQAPDREVAYLPNPTELAMTGNRIGPSIIADMQVGFNVVFAGNLGTAQAVETIVEAAHHLQDRRDIRIILVGDGSKRDWIAGQIQALDLQNLILAGRHEPEQMPGIYAAANGLIVTLADSEIFNLTIPSKIQAYLAAEKPIVAAINGEGARIIAESGAGLHCPAGDSAGLARAIENLRDMSETERLAMGKRGHDYYKAHFTPEAVLQQLISYLE